MMKTIIEEDIESDGSESISDNNTDGLKPTGIEKTMKNDECHIDKDTEQTPA